MLVVTAFMRSSRPDESGLYRPSGFRMHLYLAIFWLVVGVIGQVYWDTLKDRMNVPIERSTFLLIFVVLFGYNFMRWRMTRMAERSVSDASDPPPRPRVKREYNPDLDFGDEKSEPEA